MRCGGGEHDTARQVTNMVHAICMPDNKATDKVRIRLFNTYWFSSAPVVTQTHVNGTFLSAPLIFLQHICTNVALCWLVMYYVVPEPSI
jgi:hypothetical protein